MPAVFGITISPPPSNTIDDLRQVFKIYIKCYLSKLRSQFILYPELDKNNRLHFHGKIWRNDIEDYVKDLKILKSWCFIKIEEIKHNTSWDKYISKEWMKTREFFKLKRPLVNCFKPELPNTILKQIRRYNNIHTHKDTLINSVCNPPESQTKEEERITSY